MYILYSKHKGDKRFKATDIGAGVQVNNLIYASMFTEDQKEEADKLIKELNEIEQDWTFELRKAK